MARREIRPKDIESPDRIYSNLLKDYVEGRLGPSRFIYRAVVIKIDEQGGQFSGPDTDYDEDPPNPPNSVKARIITDSIDAYTDDSDLTTFWPMNPHDSMPIKEGEHIYVIFEDVGRKEVGLWLCRVSEHNGVNSLNFTPGSKKFEEDDRNDFTDISVEKAVQDTEADVSTPEVSDSFTVEDVPKFVQRPGDRVLHGSNNTAIIMSRDRVDSVDSGETDEAGTIDIVVGRAEENDINIEGDKSRIYITMKSQVDANFSLDSIGDSNTKNVGPTAAIALKSDEIRIKAVSGMKIVVEDGPLFIEATSIYLGPDDKGESAVLGDTWKQYFQNLLDTWAATHTHPTPSGPSGPPTATPPRFDDNSLSNTVKIKK